MSFLQWRRFTFFDKKDVRRENGENPIDRFKDVQWTCSSSGRGTIVFGDAEGFIYSCNRQLEVVTFRAYDLRVDHVYHMKQHSVLVTVGESEVSTNFQLKVWNLDKTDKERTPMCTRIVRLAPNNTSSRVTCLAVHENMNYMAVGFENGCVLLFVGDVMKETHSKMRTVHEGGKPVTNLLFRTTTNKQQQKQQHTLFVTTTDEIVSLTLLSRDKEQKVILEREGCQEKCCVLTDVNQDMQLVVGNSKAVFFYQSEAKGSCMAFEGDKTQLYWFRSYLVVVSKEKENPNRSPDQSELNVLTIYDIRNKFIAYSCLLPEIVGVFCEWGSLYVLCQDYKMYLLQEMDIQSKLDLLFKKSLYDLAITLAEQSEQGDLADIHKLYGDHLYSKGDYKEAMVQYIKTIGQLQPSYVVMKFLDPSQIENLTDYLEHLNERGLTTDNHITLLLNCYTKLKCEEKLQNFIQSGNLGFDVETTIKLCRSAGYYKQALQVAEQNKKHDHALKILLDDIKDHEKALEYISGLPFEEAESYMKKYGKELMDSDADGTTEFIKKLCSGVGDGALRTKKHSRAEDHIHIFVNNSEKLIELLEFVTKVRPNSSSYLYDTLVELYLLDYLHEFDENLKEEKKQKIFNLLTKPEATYNVTHVLMVFQVNSFKEGMIFLYEKSGMYQEMLLLYMHSDSYSDVIKTCKHFGNEETDLWVESLSYFAKKEDCKSYVVECLDYIEMHNLLPPLLVIQTLSRDSTCTLEVVKDYLIRCLRRDREEIEEKEREMKLIQEDTEKKKAEILMAETQPVVFQNHKCSLCSHLLDLPSIHFYCKHSFHQHCFVSYSSESPEDCPICLPEKKRSLERLKVQEEDISLQETFSKSLTLGSKDRFSVIAEYFGKGLFKSGGDKKVPD